MSLELRMIEAEHFCNANHCIFKLVYLPCYKEFIARIKKVTHGAASSIEGAVYQIVLEQEMEISRFRSPRAQEAVSEALRLADVELQKNGHEYFDEAVEMS